MDKYEFNVKVEQLKKLVSKGNYQEAMEIADTIDWRRVRNVNILSMAASIYEKNKEYQEAKDILLLAFERAPIGKRLLYKLAELAVAEGNTAEAEDYYREFCDLAPDDPRQYLLRYMILGAKGAPVEQLIHTLEQYCNVELDEKWLYELATLYNKAGMEELCVLACDKIMLMFGLGKYVDKAMELKLQYAPLTKYQMDLVENRDKYEARLRAVEQEYEAPVRRHYQVKEEEPRAEHRPVRSGAVRERERQEEEDHSQEAYEESAAAYEDVVPGYRGPAPQENEEEEESVYGERQPYRELHRPDQEEAVQQEPVQEDYAGPADVVAEEPLVEETEPAGQPEAEAQDGDGQEKPAEEEGKEQTSHSWEVQEPMTEEALAARVHEAEVQANLARELSRLSGAEFSEESRQAQTRVLKDIKSLKVKGNMEDTIPSSSSRNAINLMVETEDPQQGFEYAVDGLKRIHHALGIKNQAVKITGEKLNKKGVFALADKLTGRDLIVEYAGDMTDDMIEELDQLMARDETGMNVVLIDDKEQLDALVDQFPGFAKRFLYCRSTEELPDFEEEREQPRPAAKEAVREAQPVREPVKKAAPSAPRPEVKIVSKPVREEEARPEPRVLPTREQAVEAYAKSQEEEDGQGSGDEIMDIDEFAQYACQYAADIDCSISGKSMLALYERIEIMEQDGIPLTKDNAEELIEEVADKAERPPLGKRMKGLFASKYDKEGRLILREEYFL